ncbi:YWFCY domain-containing protein [Dyadobacter sp. CY347]|uniref:YWFCY domain-containing protein n=1 Tax=Dyadobacter sp. CY347 TaxID=2909336 RepID=UPI0021057458|nr:YWFCY domain-containing protein [Dyadobacter sp. CY347]
MFSSFSKTKIVTIIFLTISLVGVKGKKGEDIRIKPAWISVLTGLIIYFLSVFILETSVEEQFRSALYMVITSIGFLLILSGGSQFYRLITARFSNDIFNKDNESFPQFEQLLENEYLIALPAEYRYKGKTRQSWINIINPFRGVLVSGSPGSGKTFLSFDM